MSRAFTLRAPSREALDALEWWGRERLAALGVRLGGMRWQHRAGFHTAGIPYAQELVGRRRTVATTVSAQ